MNTLSTLSLLSVLSVLSAFNALWGKLEWELISGHSLVLVDLPGRVGSQ